MSANVTRLRSVHADARTLRHVGQRVSPELAAVIQAVRRLPGREADALELTRIRDDWNRVVARVLGEVEK